MDNYEQLQKEMARILEKMNKIQDPRGDDYRELTNRLTTLEGVRKTMEETASKAKEAETKAKELEIKSREVDVKQNEAETKAKEAEIKQHEAETKAKELEIKSREVDVKQQDADTKLREMAAKEAELVIMRRKNIGDWALKGLGIAAQVGLVLVGFCFESEESLSGFFSKAVMPKINFLGEKK